MKRMILPLILGLTLGLGGSVGFALWKGGDQASLAEAYEREIGKDSVAVQADTSAAADSLAPADSLAAHSAGVSTDSAAHAAGADTMSQGDPVDPSAAPAAAIRSESARIQPERLAKVFGTMQPREAARIMEHLDDSDVQAILGKLGDRQAAAILSNLPPERAAVISRTVIRGERSTP